MRVSIAMATYNGEKYLLEQLESFSIQTRRPDELVICDDASTDDTIEIAEQFRERAPFTVRIFQNQVNLGYTKNFEQAISKCNGDLIFLSDQDDVWHPPKIQIIELAFSSAVDKHLIIHDGELVDENLNSEGATKLGQVIAGYGSNDAFVTGALTAMRKSFLPYILPIPDGIKGHDGWIHYVAHLLDARLVINRSLQLIRRHSSNTSDWIASSTKKINRLDVWKSQFRTAPANNYRDRLLFNTASRVRLERAMLIKTSFLKETIKRGLRNLDAERRALVARDRLSRSGNIRRKLIAVGLLLKGDYRFFNGVRSFLRDLLR